MTRISLYTHLALRALNRHRLRSTLTMLGVIIGVAAVIAMVALGNGARASVERAVKSAGTNIVLVSAGNFTRGGESVKIATGLGSAITLSAEDAEAIGGVAEVLHVARGVRTRVWVDAPHRKVFALVRGTDAAIADIHGWSWARGKGFDRGAVTAAARVAVLGRTAAEQLFGEGIDPVGQTVRIHGEAFTVTGVMSVADAEQGETVFVPVTTLQQQLGIGYLQTITVATDEAGDATRVGDDIRALLRQRHRIGEADDRARRQGLGGNQLPGSGLGAPDDFTVKTQAGAAVTKGLYTSVAAFALANLPKLDQVTMEEMTSTLNRAGGTMTALLGTIAAISLVVGGIGIMNIMLIAVTERTREIGVRLAVGARRRDVRMQFLVEALVLSLAGGLVGIAAGIGASRALTGVLGWPTSVSAGAIGLAFGIAAAVGIVFGFYPAQRASGLDPIEALRHE